MLERLFVAPQLTDQVLGEVVSSFLEQLQTFPSLLGNAAAELQGDFFERARPLFEKQRKAMSSLPVGIRRPALRALATAFAFGGIGLGLIETTGIDLEQVFRLAQSSPDYLNGAKPAVAVAGVLYGIEIGRAHHSRTLELVAVADAWALHMATMLRESSPDDPQVRMPWYFADGLKTEQVRPIATWAEAETSKNDRLLEMLEEWSREPDEPDEAERWEQIKRALDEDRLSDRPLFSP